MQLSFNEEKSQADNEPVVCLGMTFKNDEERREYFREKLREKLPELKKIEGFPIGEDEDIIALSDPPYYTACPNPWINEIVDDWGNNKAYCIEEYQKYPYTSDVSIGKNDPFYNAHSYHTKVPYKAILKYILHYTNPNDIIFDGFAGTGATGVAAKACGDKEIVSALGYEIDEDNNIYQDGDKISKLGQRNVILNDLSPAATLISYNYNNNNKILEFKQEAERILKEVKDETMWMYKTKHRNNEYGLITGVIWSDVFLCPSCSNEIIYWDATVDLESKRIKKEFSCPKCHSQLNKRNMEKVWMEYFDQDIKQPLEVAKQVPVLINYKVGTKRYSKRIDAEDLLLIKEIETSKSNLWYPTDKIPVGYNTKQPLVSHGISYVHQFYTKRNLLTLACLFDKISKSVFYNKLLFFFQASINRATKTNRFRFGGTGGLSGTLYIPSLSVERSVIFLLESKLNDQLKVLENGIINNNHFGIITQSSSTNLNIKENSVDYIFTDPPFGSNIMYSELNFLWESWLKVYTNNSQESIINPVQKKDIDDYKYLMEQSFKNFYMILKPNRWMTVEFSNSQSSVWNAIQEAIQKAGFVIANVSTLDKKQGSFKAVTTTTAVKQDLVISAYKPKQENIEKMKQQINTEESVWFFVTQHLEQLPIFLGSKGAAEVISERTPRILFDRMVAYHVQNGLPVPISSAEFQSGVAQRFPMRDGMVFLESQVAEYDKKRTLVKEFTQMSLFVSDENSAIEWLRQQLMKKPQTRQDIHPNFMKELQHIAKHELLPELDDLLEQNFLRYEGDGSVPNQILTYLRRNYKDLRGLEPTDPKVVEKAMHRWYVPDPNKQADLEKLREKALLREYESYLEELEGNKRKLRTFRTEAIRAGFKKAYSDKDFKSIVKIGERIPDKIIQEDDKLLMYYDNACIRLGL